MATVPPRIPNGDRFEGVLCLWQTLHVLSATPLIQAETVAQGIILRYAARLLGKPFLGIVPELVAIDYGDFLNGEDAWEFVLKRSNLYPRADIVGYRNDGVDDMIVVKKLDLALKPMVLAYAQDEDVRPVAEAVACIGIESAFPQRTTAFLPRFDTFEAFLSEQADNQT
jgi:hypothetical protein